MGDGGVKEAVEPDESPIKTKRPNCLNCEAVLIGRYCADCGQDGERRLVTLPHLARRVLSEVTDTDGSLLRTLRLLFRRPGQLSREYSEGRFRTQIAPTRLYLASVGAYFLMTRFLGNPEVRTVREGETNVSTFVGPFLWDSELLFAILVPIWAAAVFVGLKRTSGRRYEEAFVFSVHYHVVFLACMFAITALVALSDLISSPLLATAFVTVGSLAPALYLYIALRRAFGFGWGRGTITAVALFMVHLAAGDLLFRLL